MKHIFTKLAAAFFLCLAWGSCVENLPEPYEELDLSRCLAPTNLSAKVTDGQVVQFNWTKAKGATYFVLEIYTDKDNPTLVGEAHRVELKSMPYVLTLDPDMAYYARVKGVDESGRLGDSKWAMFDGPILTSAVKSNMFLEFTAKTSTSVTVKWEALDNELERIEWKVGENAEKRSLTAEEIAAGQATVEGLQPATQYTISIWYASANRGEVTALTDPLLDGYTQVGDLTALQNALTAKAPKIFVKAAGSPYALGVYDLLSGVEILGEQGVDGSKPVIQGEFHLADGYDGKPVLFEALELNGNKEEFGFAFQIKNGAKEAKTVESIVFKNCDITGFSKGLIYEWGMALTTDRLAWDGCTIYEVNKSFENGGDGIDLRNASQINTLEIVNSTIYNGFRTFLRLDANVAVGTLKVENNTFMNVSYNAGSANTNNSGLVGVKTKPSSAFTFKNNLLVHMPDGCGFTRKAGANLTPEESGLAFANNHFFNIGASFFSETDEATNNNRVSQAAALAGSGSILSADPCFNAKGGVFNLTNADLIAARVGAPKWQLTYVEKEEDLTLHCLEGPKTWNFADAKYFVGNVEKPRVRDFLLLSAEENVLQLADGTVAFTAVSTTKKGVPTDGFVAFKVNCPGSVYINAQDPESLGNHLVVGVGPVDGSSATVKGGAVANVHHTTNQKILLSDITEESMVYIYASGPVRLSALAWALDLRQVNTALDSPAPEVTPAKVDQGAEVEATVTWAPVENAGTYSVVFSGKTYPVDGTSYTIGANVVKFLDAGSYKVEVYANPAEGDIYNTPSSAGVAVLTVAAKASEEPGSEFVVSSVADLQNAVASGKTDITLAYASSPYELGKLELTTPLRLTGRAEGGKLPIIHGQFTLSGDLGGSFILRNVELEGTGIDGAILGEVKELPLTADTVALFDCVIRNYTGRLYDNSMKNVSCVQNLIFSGLYIDNCSNGNDFIDMRGGAYHRVMIANSTIANTARTFFRTDAGSEINYLTVRNNTFYKVATNAGSKDNNGLFHVRGTGGSGMLDYRLVNNLFYSILIDEDPANAAGYPRLISKNSAALKPNVIANNYYYNIEEREERAAYSWWTVNCSREEGLAGGGVVLAADPCQNAQAGDFTLTNAVAMNANIGDPRWNPMRGSHPTSEMTVENVNDLLTAISAGKATITLKAGVYDLTALTEVPEVSGGVLTLSTTLHLIGEEGAQLIGGFKLSGPEIRNFSLRGLSLSGGNTVQNLAEIASTDVNLTSVVLKDNFITGYKNRLFYMSQEGARIASFEISGNRMMEMGTGGDFFDVRKGAVNAVRITGNTFAHGIRTFMRVDAAVIIGSVKVSQNTFYNLSAVDSKDNNGIFHVRATSLAPAAFEVSKNLFAAMHRAAEAPSNANGYPKLVSTNSANIIPGFKGNYYFDVDTQEDFNWWTKGRITAQDGLAGYGVLLTETPFRDAAAGDFTLTNALAMSERIGDPRWNPNQNVRPEDWFTVTNVEELLTAIDAGKTNVELAYGTYDLSAHEVLAGKLTLTSTLNLKGRIREGLKPVLIAGFKLEGVETAFSAFSIDFDGANTVDNFIDVTADGALLSSVSLIACDVHHYKNRFFYMNKAGQVNSLSLSGLWVHDMGTGGDCIDLRKGTVNVASLRNSTFAGGVRTLVRMDAAVVCGAFTVQNNTFYNLCAADSKDNNGIFHVRASSLSAANFIVKDNIFAAMHRAVEEPANANGYPKLVSTNSASKIPAFIGNLFFDVDGADPYSWWTKGSHETPAADLQATALEGEGQVLTETPFSAAEPGSSGKFNVKAPYKGKGDLRW